MDQATRFADWSRGQALALLAAVAGLLFASALIYQPPETSAPQLESAPAVAEQAVSPTVQVETGQVAEDGRDTDLALYDRIIERVAAGDNYYAAAVEEQRARNFPVRPGLAVRLPTLATISAMVGPTGIYVVAILVAALLVWAWGSRLAPLIESTPQRLIALALLAIGASGGFKPTYFVVHEVWAGMLLAAALALHRPGRWRGALLVAALALAIREHALPFVLLMGAFAAWRREWREMAAWLALAVGFAAVLASHVGLVARFTSEADPLSSSWLALRGLQGWIDAIALNSILYNLPSWLAAPLALLPLLGWAGLRERLGVEALLLFAGYGLLFMIAGRENNFYWGLMVTPAWFVGLYWVPPSLRDLVARARA